VTDIASSGSTNGELYGWYPTTIFSFNEPSQVSLVNIGHVLSGPIKSYDSPEDILEDSNYWKDVPLNEQVVLEMNQPGLNYLVAAIQFANGTSGVYSGTMDVDASGSKSEGEDFLDFQMDEGSDFNILDKSDIEDIQSDPGFQQAASDIICSELNKNGFRYASRKQRTFPMLKDQLLRYPIANQILREMMMKVMTTMMKMMRMETGMKTETTKRICFLIREAS
jgi:hypothetical protein